MLKINKIKKIIVDLKKIPSPRLGWVRGGRNRRYLLVGLFVALVVIILSFVLFRNSEQAKAEWFNDSWHYRQTAVVANTGAATTNQYVKITLDTSALITASKMQSDCDDLRVTDYSGNLLPYFIDGDTAYDCNETDTAIYTRLSSITKDDSNVFLYYGNVSADNNEVVLGSFEEPALSCKNILEHGDSNGNGNYYITPSGNLADKIQVYCDMTYSSGGWILVFHGLPTEAMVLDATNEKVKLSNNIIFNDIRMEGVNTNFHVSTTVTETAQLSKTIPQYYYEVDQAADLSNPQVSFHDLDGNQDVLLTSNYFLFGYGNSWRVFYTCINVSNINYIYIGGYSPTCTPRSSFASADVGCTSSGNNYCSGNARNTTPVDSGLGLSLYEYQETKTWVRENDLVLNTDQSANAPADEEIGGGPIGYWKFDEGYGTTAYDSSSNKNDGTLTSMSTTGTSTAWQVGKVGKALQFDGVNDYVNIPDPTNDSLDFGTGDFSIGVWAKITKSGNFENIISKGWPQALDTYTGYEIVNDDRGTYGYNIVAAISDGTNKRQISIPNSPYINGWHYFAVVQDYDGSTKLYIDGVVKGSSNTAFTGAGVSTDYPLTIGARSHGTITNYLKGLIDEPKIYNYALTASQILTEYNLGKSVILSQTPEQTQNLNEGLVGHWKMDESTTAWDGAGDRVNDYSGNNNAGTAYGHAHATTTAKYGNAGEFDGTDDYVRVSQTFDLTKKDFTMEAWIYRRSHSSTDEPIFTHGIGGTNQRLHFIVRSNKPYFGLYSNDFTGDIDLAQGQWYHLSFVHDDKGNGSTNGIIYVNGVFNKSAILSSYNGGDTDIEIGGGGSWNYFNGLIDEVKIYNTARTPDQIMQDYLQGPGPVAYYDFEEGSGTALSDKSGQGYNGTITAGASQGFVKGKIGRSYDFDGANTKISTTQTSNTNFTSGFTISAWIKPNSAGEYSSAMGSAIVAKGDNSIALAGFNFGLGKAAYENRLYFRINAYSGYAGDAGIVYGIWQHVVMTFSSDRTINFYINGVKRGTTIYSQSASLITSSNPLIIGSAGDGSGDFTFDGLIDDLKINNYALTPWQVAQEYNQGDPIAQWSFDEGYGTSVYNTYATSTGALTGTLSGMSTTGTSTAWQVGKIGKALMFDGINDSISFGNKSAISMSGDFSLSVWFKIPQYLGAEMVIMNKGVYQTSGFRFGISSNKFGFWTTEEGGNISVNTKSNVSLNTWHHGVVTYSGGNVNLYFDGSKAASQSNGTYTANTSGNLTVGAVYGVWPYQGLIDEVKIYNYALSPVQIKKDYNDNASVVMGTVDGGQAVQQGLVAWYKMDEATTTWDGAGDRVNDYSGNNNTGTAYGHAHATTTAKYGNSAEFDGTDDYILLTSSSLLKPSRVTISCWFKTSSVSNMTLYRWRTYGMDLRLNGGNVIFGLYNSISSNYSATTVSASYSDNIWHYVVGVYDGLNMSIYVDGILKQTVIAGVGGNIYYPANGVVAIGRDGDADLQYFDGLIDDVKVYNIARTPDQIMQDYLEGPDPIAYYDFNEGQGTTLNDKSGQGYNGTLTNSPTWVKGKMGRGLDFRGYTGAAEDYVNTNLELSSNWSSKTYSAWIYPQHQPDSTHRYEDIVLESTAFDSNKYTGLVTAGYTTYRYVTLYQSYDYGTNTIYAGNSNYLLNINQWYHVVGVIDNNCPCLKLYQNGILISTTNYASGLNARFSNLNPIQIGGGTGGYGFDSVIDEVKVWNYALTPWQIAQEYNGGAPIGYWKMDEGQGGSIYDWSGNGYHGTLSLNGSPATSTAWQTSTNCKVNGCLAFDGSNDLVNTGSDMIGTGDDSVSVWIYLNSISNFRRIIDNGKTWLTIEADYCGIINSIEWRSDGGTCTGAANNAITTGRWYHIAATRTSAGIHNIYINGVLSGAPNQNGNTPVVGDNAVILGNRLAGDIGFNGKIDDVRLYNYVLSPAQIKELYNAGFGTYFK